MARKYSVSVSSHLRFLNSKVKGYRFNVLIVALVNCTGYFVILFLTHKINENVLIDCTNVTLKRAITLCFGVTYAFGTDTIVPMATCFQQSISYCLNDYSNFDQNIVTRQIGQSLQILYIHIYIRARQFHLS